MKHVSSLTIVAFFLSGSNIQAGGTIKGWEQITAPAGYVLSLDLEKRGCRQIWERQVPAFQGRNPQVQDPDVIPQGAQITVQLCEQEGQDAVVAAVPANSEIVKMETPSEPANTELQVEKAAPAEFTPQAYLHLFLGFLTEKGKDEVSPSAGLGVTGDLFPFLGYNLQLLGASSVLALKNEVRFKTLPAATRYHLIFGLGNRIGLKNRDLDRLTTGVDSFTYGGLGVEFRPGDRYRLLLDATTNLGSRFSLNGSASAQKRYGEDFWLGVYAEYQSTRSAVDYNKADRNYLTGGVKASF